MNRIFNDYISQIQTISPSDFSQSDFIDAGQSIGWTLIDYGVLSKDSIGTLGTDTYVEFSDKQKKKIIVRINSKTKEYIYSVPILKEDVSYKGKGPKDFLQDIMSSFNKNPIYSFTAKELLDARDGNFIHHDKYTSELTEPELEYAYCNTLKFSIKSSNYGKKVKGGTNITKYKVFVLFEDFYTIGSDKDIDFEDAIDYAINFGDIHVRCTCPAAQFWGYNFEGTSLRYLYGIPRENRFPKIRNPNLQGTICKHTDKVLQWILKHKDIVAKLFATYYGRLDDRQSIYAVNTNGTTITIGKKNEEGDVFFDRQLDEQEEQNMEQEPEEQVEETVTEETSEDIDNLNPDTWWEDEDNVTDIEEE